MQLFVSNGQSPKKLRSGCWPKLEGITLSQAPRNLLFQTDICSGKFLLQTNKALRSLPPRYSALSSFSSAVKNSTKPIEVIVFGFSGMPTRNALRYCPSFGHSPNCYPEAVDQNVKGLPFGGAQDRLRHSPSAHSSCLRQVNAICCFNGT